MRNRVLVTGGVGFVGHHLIEHFLKNTEWDVVTLDRIDCSSTLFRLYEVLKELPNERGRVQFVFHDLKAEINSYVAKQIGRVTHITNLAEDHTTGAKECLLELMH